MTEETLNNLFQKARNEQPTVAAHVIESWIDTTLIAYKNKKVNNLQYTIIIGLIVTAIAVVIWYLLSLKPEPIDESFTKRPAVKKTQINVPNIHVTATKDEISNQFVETNLNDEVVQAIVMPDGPITDAQPLNTFSINSLHKKELKPVDLGSTSQTQDSVVIVQDLLFILDSIKGYKTVVGYKMDDPDCYLQIIKGYAVISYKYRGKQFFAAGTIHRTEQLDVDGLNYTVYAFQIDNKYPVLNFGKRVFFGVREVDAKNNKYEVLLFSQPWAPSQIMDSHIASEFERKKLEARSE